jgi:hypothetical protein
MKRIVYLLLSVSIFLSCKDKTGDTGQDANGKPLDQSQALMHQFKPLINGVWVKKDYIKKVKKSKSPLEAVEKGTGITIMYIDTAQLKGDSIAVPIILNNHEGTRVSLSFQPGKNTTTVMLGKDELSYKLKKDTILIIYHYNADSRETDVTQYIKAMDKQPAGGLAAGMNMTINEALLAGKYEGTDALGKRVYATFTNDGKVTGLPGLTTYYIQNDLIADPEHSHDEIIFNMKGTGQKSYAFVINKKTISLYDNEGQVKSNKPSYSLKRKAE